MSAPGQGDVPDPVAAGVAPPASTPRLAVIVPAHDAAATLAHQLAALTTQTCPVPWEVVVVDNRSTDATAAVAEVFAGGDPPVRVVHADERANLSYARNAGVAATTAPLVAFADADDEVGPGWVAAMAAALEEHELVASRLDWGPLNTDPGVLTDGFQSGEVGWFLGHPGVVGAGHGCRREVWERLGGNDEGWDDGGEDFEFSFRAHRDLGLVPWFAADAEYRYRARATPSGVYRQARRNGAAKARLVREFAGGHPASGAEVRQAVKTWAWLAVHAADLARPDRRLAWLRVAGDRAGRLRGSLRHRVLYP